MTEKSPAEYIGQYIKIRNYIAAQEATFKKAMEPYHAALEQIEGHMAGVLQQQAGADGKASIATAQGTCFRKLQTSIKVVDREDWMDFIFDGRREGFITNHVSKDAIREYMDQFQSTPPGIDVVPFYQIQFNSPKGE